MDAASATTFGTVLVVFNGSVLVGLGLGVVFWMAGAVVAVAVTGAVAPFVALLLLLLLTSLVLVKRGLSLALTPTLLSLVPKKSSELFRIPVFFLARSRTDFTRLRTPYRDSLLPLFLLVFVLVLVGVSVAVLALLDQLS